MSGDDALVALAGLGAGFANGVGGGGSLISFPALLAVGLPAVRANVTSTVGIWAGFLGGAAGFRAELAVQRRRIRELVPVALAGGIAGALLLLATPSRLFEHLAPLLILAAVALFAVQPRLAARLRARAHPSIDHDAVPRAALVGGLAASVYGGYFGAGLGVILLAVLGLALDEELVHINGLRGLMALCINSTAVVVFAAGAHVAWGHAATLAGTSLVGGYAGARLARRLPVPAVRGAVLSFGAVAALRLLLA